MSITIFRDERWPDYRIEEKPDSRYDTVVEVDDDMLARWRAAITAYNIVQREMELIYLQGAER